MDVHDAVCPVQFDQSGTTFSDYTAYSGNNSEKYHQAFITYFTDIVTLLGAPSGEAAAAAEEVWQLETQISDVSH